LIQNEITEAICSRRSIRNYTDEPISKDTVSELLECARFAPSGLNNQPWRFVVIDDRTIGAQLSALTHYSDIVSSAPLLIAVFLDTASSYHHEKDLMAIGASIQNILLAAHSLKLGAVWLGEILKNKEAVSEILNTPENFELTAVIAVGHPATSFASSLESSSRKSLNEIVFKNKYEEI